MVTLLAIVQRLKTEKRSNGEVFYNLADFRRQLEALKEDSLAVPDCILTPYYIHPLDRSAGLSPIPAEKDGAKVCGRNSRSSRASAKRMLYRGCKSQRPAASGTAPAIYKLSVCGRSYDVSDTTGVWLLSAECPVVCFLWIGSQDGSKPALNKCKNTL